MLSDHDLIHKLIELIEYKNHYQQQTARIQPQDMYVLERVCFNQRISAKNLTQNYHIPASTLTGILDRLEQKQLICRIRSTDDRRSILLAATERGSHVVEKHLEEDRRFARNLFGRLDTGKRELLRSLLSELLTDTEHEQLFHQTDGI